MIRQLPKEHYSDDAEYVDEYGNYYIKATLRKGSKPMDCCECPYPILGGHKAYVQQSDEYNDGSLILHVGCA